MFGCYEKREGLTAWNVVLAQQHMLPLKGTGVSMCRWGSSGQKRDSWLCRRTESVFCCVLLPNYRSSWSSLVCGDSSFSTKLKAQLAVCISLQDMYKQFPSVYSEIDWRQLGSPKPIDIRVTQGSIVFFDDAHFGFFALFKVLAVSAQSRCHDSYMVNDWLSGTPNASLWDTNWLCELRWLFCLTLVESICLGLQTLWLFDHFWLELPDTILVIISTRVTILLGLYLINYCQSCFYHQHIFWCLCVE